MKSLVLLVVVASFGSALSAGCLDDACSQSMCNSNVAHPANQDSSHLTYFVNSLVHRSYSDLLTSMSFTSHQRHRPGFAKMFDSMSDRHWGDLMKVVKHMHKRGMHLTAPAANAASYGPVKFEHAGEVAAMASALDHEKHTANAGLTIAKHNHDAEITSFFENEILHQDVEMVHKLAGHVNDLKRFALEKNSNVLPLAIEVFDSYLLDKY